jgi:hypothetical protein
MSLFLRVVESFFFFFANRTQAEEILIKQLCNLTLTEARELVMDFAQDFNAPGALREVSKVCL